MLTRYGVQLFGINRVYGKMSVNTSVPMSHECKANSYSINNFDTEVKQV